MGKIIRLTEGQLCDLILEAQSVADNLIDCAEKIYDDINVWLRHNYQRTDWESKVFSYDYEDIYYKECEINIPYTFYGYPLLLIMHLYDFGDMDTIIGMYKLLKAYKHLTQGEARGGRFRWENERLNVSVSGIIMGCFLYDKGTDFDILVHELVHAYQFALKKKKKPNMEQKDFNTPIYNSSYPQNYNSFEYLIGNLVYYLEPTEQDAYLQSYYLECKNNYETFIDTQNTYMGKILAVCQYGINTLKTNLDNPDMANIFDEYRKLGYSPQRLLKYCQNGYDRLYKKYLRVYGRLKNEWDEKLNK